MKLVGGKWWFGVELPDGRWFIPFNVLPRELWGFTYGPDWHDGPLYEIRLGFFNINWRWWWPWQ